MDNLQFSVISSLTGTITIIFIYIYLYILYRERYMGIWTVSWLILLARFLLLDSSLITWKESLLGLTLYQILTIVSTIMFVWGTHIFMNKPLKKWWIQGTVIALIISFIVNILSPTLAYKLLLPIYFCCFIGIWIGLTFVHRMKVQGVGRFVTGYAFILWSLLSAAMPFGVDGSNFRLFGYTLGGILRLVIALGTLVVYFEKTRMNLISKDTQYRLFAENAADVIYYYQLKPDLKIEYISPAVFSTTGYTPEEYYANNSLILDLIHPDDQALLHKFIDTLPNSVNFPLTLRLINRDKTVLWLESKCVPIYDEKRQLVAIQGIVRDISVRKKLEKMSSLFDRMNMVGSMAATVAHEIRNPLTTVRGYLQIMRRKKEYMEDKEKFNLMIEEIDRANSIIKEYLSLSREKIAILKQNSLNTIIEALYPLIQADAISSKVVTSLHLTPIPDLLLDENEIRQLLLNLIRNSIEAMPLGGNLSIKTFRENEHVVLAVSDQGSGIPAHILDNIGTPFITTKDTGTGLGLPICYQIAHRHNAHVRINTNNQGTTFLVYFSPIEKMN